MVKNQLNYFGISLILVIFSISFLAAAAIQPDLHVNIQTTDGNGDVVTGTFNFQFNITTDSACTNVVYSNSTSLTTDSRGIISYYLENVNLDYSNQYWLCYYRDGTLQNNSQIARTPYAFRAEYVNVSGIQVDSNFDLGSFNFSAAYLSGDGSGLTNLNVSAVNYWIKNVTDLYYTAGSVGIGTTNPGVALDVVGIISSSSDILADNSVQATQYMRTPYITPFTSGGNIDFRNYAGGSSYLSVNTTSGNVGVGTTNPNYNLDINGTFGIEGDTIYFETDTGGSADLRIGAPTTPGGASINRYLTVETYSGGVKLFGEGSAADALYLGTGNGGAENIVLTLTADDNASIDSGTLFVAGTTNRVGVGTTNPQGILDVNANTDQTVYLGRALIDSRSSDQLFISHYDMSGTTGYALRQTSAGYTIVNSNSGSPLDFRINDNSQMRIASTGEVGIGTTTPQELLHVAGNALINGTLNMDSGQINNLANGTSAQDAVTYSQLLSVNGSASIESDPYWSGNSTLVPYLASANTFTNNNVFNQNLTVDTNTLFVDSSTNRVGIGTTSPDRTFSVNSGGVDVVSVFESSDPTVRLALKDSSTTSDLSVGIGANADTLNLIANGGTGLTINGSNVGIGTNSPDTKLEIAGALAGYGLHLDSSTGVGVDVDRGAQNNYYGLYFSTADTTEWHLGDDGSSTGNFKIMDGLAGVDVVTIEDGANANSFYIDSTGGVGIGTSAPQNELHVAGNALINGTLNMDSGQINNLANGTSAQDAVTYSQLLSVNGSASIESDPYWSGNYSAYNDSWTTTDAEIWGVAGNGTLALNSYVDSQDTTFNNSIAAYVNSEDTRFNNSIASYVDSQDVVFNNSIASYVDSRALSDFTDDILWTAGFNSTGDSRWLSGSFTESDPYWTGNSTLVPYLASANTFTNNNVFNQNLTVDTNTLFVNSNDNRVGIGTASPSYSLDVRSNTAFDLSSANAGQDTIFISDTNAGASQPVGTVAGSIMFGSPFSGTADNRKTGIAAVQTGGDNDQMGLGFYTHLSTGDSGDIAQTMVLTHQGRLGIGTLYPNSTIHVIGDINATTNIFSGGFVNATTDICIEGGTCLSQAGTGSGDITAVNTNGPFLSGGSTSGDASLTFNTGNFNTTYDNRYLGITAKAADSDLLDGLDSTNFYNASNPANYINAGQVDAAVTDVWVNESGDTMTGDLTLANTVNLSLGTTAGNSGTIFFGDGDTYIAEGTDDTLRFTAGGGATDNFQFSSGILTGTTGQSGASILIGGNLGSPTYGFRGDTDTGVSRVAADSLALVTAGSNALTVDSSQRVGIGTDSPGQNLQIEGTDAKIRFNDTTYPTAYVDIGEGSGYLNVKPTNNYGILVRNSASDSNYVSMGVPGSYARIRYGETTGIILDSDGDVGINTLTPQNELNVGGDANVTGTVYVGSSTQASMFVDGNGDMIFRI